MTVTLQQVQRLLRRMSWQLPLVLIVSLFAAILGFYLMQTHPAAAHDAAERQQLVLDQLSNRIHDHAERVLRHLKTTETWLNNGTLDPSDIPAFNRLLSPMLTQDPLLTRVRVAIVGQKELMLEKITPQGWRNRLIVADQPETPQWFAWNDHGLVPLSEAASIYRARDQPWFQAALIAPDQQVIWTLPYKRQDQSTGITAALRCQRPDGRLIILAFDLNLADFSNITRNLLYGSGGKTAIVDAKGRWLAGDDADTTQRLLEPITPQTNPVLAAALSALRAQPKQTLNALDQRIKGQDWIISARNLDLGGHPLTLITYAPASDFSPPHPTPRAGAIGAVRLHPWRSPSFNPQARARSHHARHRTVQRSGGRASQTSPRSGNQITGRGIGARTPSRQTI